MTTYIIQMIVFQLVFLVLYEWLLKKETFFQWNRVYLVLTPVIAILLPFVKISALQTIIPQNLIVSLPEITLGSATTEIQSNLAVANPSFSLFEIIILTGILISTLLFLWKLYKILQLKRKGNIITLKNTTLVHIPKCNDAFSFAGTIFLGENLNEQSKEQILAHEMVHVKQKHYLDLLYFELLRILFWFNPMVYFYQNRIATLHEYIADAEVVSQSGRTTYYQNLLSEIFQTHTVSFVNTFFNQSLIKKRIVMLQKSKSEKAQLAKYFLLLPFLAAMICVSSCEQKENPAADAESVTPIVTIDTIKNSKNTINDVPFALIDQVPVYPGCDNLATNEELKKCFSDKISQLVSENFDTSIAKNIGLTGRQRIAVQFKIDTDGNVSNIVARSPSEILVEEAERVMQLIPKMTPGIQNEKEVNVLYSLPIIFEVNK